MSIHASGVANPRALARDHCTPIAKPRRRRRHPSLADDPDFWASAEDRRFRDDDREVFTWRDTIDQTRLWDASAPDWLIDDDEDDDPDTGIDDEPHDARTEDGL